MEIKDYIVKHATRHFILAADSQNVLNSSTTFKDASKFLPDQTGKTALLGDLTLLHIKMELGLNPFILSCHACFAQMFSEEQLQQFISLKYSELSAGIYAWEKVLAAGTPDEDSSPPNFHTLVSTALERQDI